MQLQRLLITGYSLAVLAPCGKNTTKIIQCSWVVRLKLQCVPKSQFSIGLKSLLLQHQSQIVVSLGQVRHLLQNLSVSRLSLL